MFYKVETTLRIQFIQENDKSQDCLVTRHVRICVSLAPQNIKKFFIMFSAKFAWSISWFMEYIYVNQFWVMHGVTLPNL